jgi:hypothetical protein
LIFSEAYAIASFFVANGQISEGLPFYEIAIKKVSDKTRNQDSAELGPVDGFDEDQYAGETDYCVKAGRGLFASHCDALEAFQFAYRLFHSGSCFIQDFREKPRPFLYVGTVRDHWRDATLTAGRAVRF